MEPEAARNVPSIDIVVSSDTLSASLNIIPATGDVTDITSDDIYQVLNQNNIISGVNEGKIRALVQRFNREKGRIENEEIAKGLFPKPGKQGPIQPCFPFMTERPLVEALLKTKAVPHISDITAIHSGVKHVNPGEVIAKRGADVPGAPGTDVRGNKVPSTQTLDNHETYGKNVGVEDNGHLFRATASGVILFAENYLEVVHVDFDAHFEVEISLDKMVARGRFLPSGEGGTPLNPTLIEHTLHDNRIVFGIQKEQLEQIVHQVNTENKVIESVDIAIGQKAADGANGHIEYFFNTSGNLKPKEMEDGSVNFKDVSVIESVEENHELARIHHPTKGVPGTDVCGTLLPAKDGNPLKLPVGPNTSPHPSNPDVLIATKAGIVRLSGSVIEITEGYFVNGDVDFATGNIKYGKSVKIKKDVKSGFSVEAGGDLDIGGLVEDSNLFCDGNVVIKGGFVGSGKGEIIAAGSVNIGFVRNQTIKSRGDVNIAKESINAKIFARNNIHIYGKTVVGGKLSARNEITGLIFGNSEGSRTDLEVGLDFTLLEEKYKTEEKIKALMDNHKKANETLTKFEKMKKIKKVLQPKQEFLYKKLAALVAKLDTQLVALEKRKEMIEEKLREVGKARIIVKDRILPGTMIKIGDRHFAVQQEILGPKSILLVNGKIEAV